MKKTTTTRYDVAEHLRTPEEMAAYLEACLEEANGEKGGKRGSGLEK
jgi:DNA-binding phage protein